MLEQTAGVPANFQINVRENRGRPGCMPEFSVPVTCRRRVGVSPFERHLPCTRLRQSMLGIASHAEGMQLTEGGARSKRSSRLKALDAALAARPPGPRCAAPEPVAPRVVGLDRRLGQRLARQRAQRPQCRRHVAAPVAERGRAGGLRGPRWSLHAGQRKTRLVSRARAAWVVRRAKRGPDERARA